MGTDPVDAVAAPEAGVPDEAKPTDVPPAARTPRPPTPSQRTRPRRNWGWLIAPIVLVLLAGGGYGYYTWTNVSGRDAWQTYLTSSDTIGTLKIPALGADFVVPIRPGTSPEMLRQGVGWYPGTTAPGQWGNFAVAGYRLGWGQPFFRLASLQLGDTIIVETAGRTYTYTVVTGPITVSSTDTDILSAVPGGPGITPTRALITLTTAQDLLPTRDRTIVIGQLTE